MTTKPKLERDDSEHRINIFTVAGFHGDHHLLRIVDDLAAKVGQFIETGTEAGSTVAYVARMYPHLVCFTCEADEGTLETARRNFQNALNIHSEHALSQEWMRQLPVAPALFWLDAHSHGFGCPLGEEVQIALDKWPGGYILIDDFQVPGRPEFGFDWYVGSQHGEYKLTWDTIVEGVSDELKSRITAIHYPNYTPPRIGARGWVLIQFGNAARYEPPEYVQEVLAD